jgi:type II secretory pathway predicted ATPase ExeA
MSLRPLPGAGAITADRGHGCPMSLYCERQNTTSARPETLTGGVRAARSLQAWLNEAPQLEAFARLQYLLSRPFGCGLLTGPGQCGKSLILQSFRSQLLRSQATVLHADGAGLDADGLAWHLAAECGLGPDTLSQPRCLRQSVADFLQGLLEAGRRVVFLLDHADAMGPDALHAYCRILRTAEGTGRVTAIWVARWPLTPVLRDTLLPLTELRIDVSPLSERETEAYVLQSSGLPAGTIDPAAIAAIREHAAGQLRRVDHLCELALLAAQADGRPTISRELVDAVALELA